jgi:hypothetical protein
MIEQRIVLPASSTHRACRCRIFVNAGSGSAFPSFDADFVDVLSALDAERYIFYRSVQGLVADTTLINAGDGLPMFLEAVFEESRGATYEI